jgi:predicted NodU family carbamoyl transferase
VNTPEDAVRCFLSTGIDALVIGDYVVVKRPSP